MRLFSPQVSPSVKWASEEYPPGAVSRRGSNSTQSGGLPAVCAALDCFGHISFPQCPSSSETPAKGHKKALRTFLIEIHTHLQVSHYTSVFCFRGIATQVLCRNSVFFNPSGHNWCLQGGGFQAWQRKNSLERFRKVQIPAPCPPSPLPSTRPSEQTECSGWSGAWSLPHICQACFTCFCFGSSLGDCLGDAALEQITP